jgi:hypothetical protein
MNPSLTTWSTNPREDFELYRDRGNSLFNKVTLESLLRVSALHRGQAIQAQMMVTSMVDIIRTSVQMA